MTSFIFLLILSYLIGSISGSMLIGKINKVDIRKSGSGNAGATNALRTQGILFALPVLVIDIGKGYVAAEFLNNFPIIQSNFLEGSDYLFFGAASIIGHCYPIFHNFKGGKGAGTALGAIISIYPSSILSALIVWISSVILTGFVGFSTILAGLTITIFSLIDNPVSNPLSLNNIHIFCIFISFFILFMHKINILRMLKGNENQFKKVMILKNIFNK
tara:strand:- start:2740 stop:3390 length:651 start_codon:yes stop_codon:yes gene_type:complete